LVYVSPVSFTGTIDTIYTIKELLRVKFGVMFFDAEQVDCLLADLCTG